MFSLIRKVIDNYHYVSYELSDPRTRDTSIMCSPLLVIVLAIVYYKFVKRWGPAFMESRQPYNIKSILIWYNLVQVAISACITYKVLVKVYVTGHYSLSCERIPTVETPEEKEIMLYIWLYYLTKIIDLLDTVFFILRKNYRQVTFLHLYHHIGMIFLGFIGYTYVPGGHGVLLVGVNSMVHTFMYFYYFLSVINDQYKKSIWWKKHITQLQIIQFFVIIVHFGQVFFRDDCGYPKWVCCLVIPNNVLIMYLFSKFYYDNYIQKKPKSE